MARVRKHLASGKLGNTVTYATPYGQAERSLPKRNNPRTSAQVRSRSSLGRASARWRIIAQEQRVSWISTALHVNSKPRLGQCGHLTGCQLYVKINCTLAACGEPFTDTPPERPTFDPSPVGALTITNDDGDIALKLGVSRAPTCTILVFGTAPCSAGMSVPRRFVLLGRLSAPVARVCDITALYQARFGVPPVGSRVFIRTVQAANGWESSPAITTAIVPAE